MSEEEEAILKECIGKVESQSKPLPAECAQILNDHFWEMYEQI